jgi:Zn-finger nucleic acid-binding protein
VSADCYLCTGCRGTWLCERHRIASSERAARIADECEQHAAQRARDDEEFARSLTKADRERLGR